MDFFRLILRLSLIILMDLGLSWSYELKTCCSTDKYNQTRLLSCPLNFVIKLRAVIFHAGNSCAISSCQKRLNKHYLYCNHQRTCSISVECISMDSSACASTNKVSNQSEYLTVDYDCQLYQTDPPLKKDQQNLLLFSAHVNIESPPELFNETSNTYQEQQWTEYLLKKYLEEQQKPNQKTVLIEQSSSLLTDVFRTILILIIFAFILIILMLIGLCIYRRKKMNSQKHRPFPCHVVADDAYDNLKTSPGQSISDSGTATDV